MLMKKQTIVLLVFGSVCMAFKVLCNDVFFGSLNFSDFAIGIGAAFIISALLVQKKFELH
jgi:uncharacterized membrane protein YgaE (UPF0421/DUF939 family)